MSEQEKKQQRIYDLLNTKTKPKKISKIIGFSLWPPSNPDLNPLHYTKWSIFENKTNVTSHPNIGLFKTAIVEEWNRMSEESIWKTYKLFWRSVDSIIEKKNNDHIE